MPENSLDIQCNCPECNSRLKVSFSGDPKKGFSEGKASVIKKGKPEPKPNPEPEPKPNPEPEPKPNPDDDKNFISTWYNEEDE